MEHVSKFRESSISKVYMRIKCIYRAKEKVMIKVQKMIAQYFYLLLISTIPFQLFSQQPGRTLEKIDICYLPVTSKFRIEPHLDKYINKKCSFCKDAFYKLAIFHIPKEIESENKLQGYFQESNKINYNENNPIIRAEIKLIYNKGKPIKIFMNTQGYFLYKNNWYSNSDLLSILFQDFDDRLKPQQLLKK